MKEREIMTSIIAIIPRDLRGKGIIAYMERPLAAMEINEEVIKPPWREIHGWCRRCKEFHNFMEADFSINNKQQHGIKYECVKCGTKYRKKTILRETIRHLEDADADIEF